MLSDLCHVALFQEKNRCHQESVSIYRNLSQPSKKNLFLAASSLSLLVYSQALKKKKKKKVERERFEISNITLKIGDLLLLVPFASDQRGHEGVKIAEDDVISLADTLALEVRLYVVREAAPRRDVGFRSRRRRVRDRRPLQHFLEFRRLQQQAEGAAARTRRSDRVAAAAAAAAGDLVVVVEEA